MMSRFDLNRMLREAEEDGSMACQKTVRLTQDEIRAVMANRKKTGNTAKQNQGAK